MSIQKTVERRLLVYSIIQDHDTLSPTEIIKIAKDKHKTKLYLKSTKSDIEYLNTQNYKWMHEQAKDAWHYSIRWMHDNTKRRIRIMDKMIQEILDAPEEPPKKVAEFLSFLEDPEDREKIEAYLHDLHAATKRVRVLGKVAYANSIITDQQRFVTELMQDQPLYEAMMEYSRDFHNWNRQRLLKEDNKTFQEDNK